DGRIDEGTDEACYDGPPDTANVGPCRAGARACVAEPGSDASAFGPCEGAVLPAAERCNDVDDDCDGRVDADADGPVQQACYPFDEGEPGVGLCVAGRSTCAAGAFGPCDGAAGPRAELPNTIDDDCDGQVDEGS
ncbi:MAG: hypothetical protein KC583_14510, partial [Myxococcales bacterium]|nr:hypothetical protein [Myxococcales bacterium]